MPDNAPLRSTLELVARFPEGYFLENLAIRSDGSLLVTVLNKGELWCVPPYDGKEVEAVRIQSFDHNSLGLVEFEPDVFLICVCNFYQAPYESHLYRIDLNGWQPGAPVEATRVFTFPTDAHGLNGACLLGPKTLLVAACFSGQIWRVDVGEDGAFSARVWLEHESMGYFPGAMKPEQPGVNAVRYDQRRSHVYYTSTAQKLLMRVHANPWNLKADSAPELVVAGRMGDDFCIDEQNEYVYLTTHRQNTLDRVAMNPAINSDFTYSVAGDPSTDELIGPSSLVWGNKPGDIGRVAYLLTDGGTASPPPTGARPAKILRVTLL